MAKLSWITGFLLLIVGGLGVGGAAMAEEERFKPRLECGEALPKGKQVYNGRSHRELVGPVVERTRVEGLSPPYDFVVVQRYAILKRSKCWVSFWSHASRDMAQNKVRMTGNFVETLDYGDDGGPVEYGERVGEIGRDLIVQLDQPVADCVAEYHRINASLPRILGRRSEQDHAIHRAALERREACFAEGAKALDTRGFLGKWYSSDDRDNHVFAVIDGKLTVMRAQ